MRKIIIKHDESIIPEKAMRLVNSVINGGRISKTAKGKQYCFATSFGSERRDFWVYADLTKSGTDVFTVLKEPV